MSAKVTKGKNGGDLQMSYCDDVYHKDTNDDDDASFCRQGRCPALPTLLFRFFLASVCVASLVLNVLVFMHGSNHDSAHDSVKSSFNNRIKTLQGDNRDADLTNLQERLLKLELLVLKDTSQIEELLELQAKILKEIHAKIDKSDLTLGYINKTTNWMFEKQKNENPNLCHLEPDVFKDREILDKLERLTQVQSMLVAQVQRASRQNGNRNEDRSSNGQDSIFKAHLFIQMMLAFCAGQFMVRNII